MTAAVENGVLINVASLKGSLSSCGVVPFAINLSNLLNDLEGVHESPNTEVTKGFQAITRFLQASKSDKFVAYRLMKRAYDALNDLIENHIGIDDDIERDLLLMSWNQLVMDRMESLIKASDDYLFCIDLDEAEEFDEKYGVKTRAVYDDDGDDCCFSAMLPILPGLFPRINIPVGSVVLPASEKIVQLHRLPMVAERIGVSACPFFAPEKEEKVNESDSADVLKDPLAYLGNHTIQLSVNGGFDTFIVRKNTVDKITDNTNMPVVNVNSVEEKYAQLCETFKLTPETPSYINILKGMIKVASCNPNSSVIINVNGVTLTMKGGQVTITAVPFAKELMQSVWTMPYFEAMIEAAKMLGKHMEFTNGVSKEIKTSNEDELDEQLTFLKDSEIRLMISDITYTFKGMEASYVSQSYTGKNTFGGSYECLVDVTSSLLGYIKPTVNNHKDLLKFLADILDVAEYNKAVLEVRLSDKVSICMLNDKVMNPGGTVVSGETPFDTFINTIVKTYHDLNTKEVK